jgi:hypothetical protein
MKSFSIILVSLAVFTMAAPAPTSGGLAEDVH